MASPLKHAFSRALVANYRATGDYAFMNEHELHPSALAKPISTNEDFAESICRGTCNGVDISYLSKTWFAPEKCNRELYFYSETDLLGSLQGDVVLELIHPSVKDGPNRVQLAFALPHAQMWQMFFAGTPLVHKEQVIAAYQKLHSRGILHGSPSVHNMILGYDLKVHITDFSRAESLNGNEEHLVKPCTPEALAVEMRQVKFLLDYDGAREKERAHSQRYCAILKANTTGSHIREDTKDLPAEERNTKEMTLMSEDKLETPEGERLSDIFTEEPPFSTEQLDSWASTVPRKHTVVRVPWAPSPSSGSSEPLASSSKKRPRSSETEQQEAPSSKRVKHSVRFHPDTEDNRLWGTLRTYGEPLRRRPSSPHPRKSGQPITVPFGPDPRINRDSVKGACDNFENPKKAFDIFDSMVIEDMRSQEASIGVEIDPDSPRDDMNDIEVPRCSPSPELRAQVAELEKDDPSVANDSVTTSLAQSGDWLEARYVEIFDTPLGTKPILPSPKDVENIHEEFFSLRRQPKSSGPVLTPYKDKARIESLMARLVYWASGNEEAQSASVIPSDHAYHEGLRTAVNSSGIGGPVASSVQEISRAVSAGPPTYRRSLSPSPSPTILQKNILTRRKSRAQDMVPSVPFTLTAPKESLILTAEQAERINQILTRHLSHSDGYEKATQDAAKSTVKRTLS